MLITASNICHYLIARRVISSESVVDGDFAVIDVSGRNRNFKVIRQFHAGYFVKQIQQWDEQTVAMLQCEAACYWLARNDSDFAPLATVMPEFHSYDLLHIGVAPERTDKFYDRLDELIKWLRTNKYQMVRIDQLLKAMPQRSEIRSHGSERAVQTTGLGNLNCGAGDSLRRRRYR